MKEEAYLNGFNIVCVRALKTYKNYKEQLMILLAPDVLTKAYPMVLLLANSKLVTQSL